MTDLISRQDAIALLEGLREQCAFLGSGEMLTEAVETITNMPSAGVHIELKAAQGSGVYGYSIYEDKP